MVKKHKGNLVIHNIGKLLLIVAGSMLLPLLTAIIYGEGRCGRIFFMLMPCVSLLGLLMMYAFRPQNFKPHLKIRESAAIVTYGWLLAAFVGMFPYLLAGTFDTAADAFFESMSGLPQ